MTDPIPATTGAADAAACPTCGVASVPGDRFCEACGASLVSDGPARDGSAAKLGSPVLTTIERAVERPNCRNCGSAPDTIGADLYCQLCGFKQPSPRDHLEIVLSRTAGVTDKGVHHYRNEDAMAFVEVGDSTVVVVCDGVSTSVDPDVASQMAVDLAAGMLATAVRERPGQLRAVAVEAAAAAQSAVAGLYKAPDRRLRPGPLDAEASRGRSDLGPPSCTYVSAVVHEGLATLAWIGDSRVYWLGPGPPAPAQLTVDDSWAVEQVAAGLMTVQQAEADPRCHAITRWLGADAPTGPPQMTEMRPEGPGLLLVCSDGLWNYASPAERIAALVETAPDGSPLTIARHLTQFAIDAGGHDNIAVVIVPVHPGAFAPEAAADPDTAELSPVCGPADPTPNPPATQLSAQPAPPPSVVSQEQHP